MRFKLKLDADSIRKLRGQLYWVKNDLNDRTMELIDNMCREGESFAINEVGHIDTGETLSSIRGYRNGMSGVIVAGGNAIWIEFGTGVGKNAGNSHPPVADPGGITLYAHGAYGKGHGANPNGWWYQDETTKEIKHTTGIQGNQFLYNTAKFLAAEFPDIADEVFK